MGGQVFQVRLKHTGKVYAMKVMRKDRILEKNHGDYIKAERDVLTAVLHPYIVALRYSFQARQQPSAPVARFGMCCMLGQSSVVVPMKLHAVLCVQVDAVPGRPAVQI